MSMRTKTLIAALAGTMLLAACEPAAFDPNDPNKKPP